MSLVMAVSTGLVGNLLIGVGLLAVVGVLLYPRFKERGRGDDS